MMLCLTIGPDATEKDHGLKPLKPWAMVNLSSF
jgi:hypothetical protein